MRRTWKSEVITVGITFETITNYNFYFVVSFVDVLTIDQLVMSVWGVVVFEIVCPKGCRTWQEFVVKFVLNSKTKMWAFCREKNEFNIFEREEQHFRKERTKIILFLRQVSNHPSMYYICLRVPSSDLILLHFDN